MPSLDESDPMTLEKTILKFGHCIFRYSVITLWKRAGPSFVHLNKLESLSPKNALCQVWMEKKILKFLNVFSLFCYYFPLEKGEAIHLKNLNPLHPRNVCTVVLEKKIFSLKYR